MLKSKKYTVGCRSRSGCFDDNIMLSLKNTLLDSLLMEETIRGKPVYYVGKSQGPGLSSRLSVFSVM